MTIDRVYVGRGWSVSIEGGVRIQYHGKRLVITEQMCLFKNWKLCQDGTVMVRKSRFRRWKPLKETVI